MEEIVNMLNIWYGIVLKIVLLAIGLYYFKTVFKSVFEAFKGEDGRLSVGEFGKAVVIGILIYMTHENGTRTHEWTLFSDMVFGIFVVGLFFIAELKDAVVLIIKYLKNGKNGNGKNDNDKQILKS